MFKRLSRRCAAPVLALALVLASFLLAAPAGAQTLAGAVFDGTGGPLLAGQTYTVIANITVPAGETLTIQPGVAVKFSANTQAVINGTLVADGSVSSPIVMTSFRDNLAPGAGTAEPGDWRGLIFGAASDASTLDHVDIRFTGTSGFSALTISSADITVDSCSVSEAAADAVSLDATAARPLISNCTFSNNAGIAIDRVQLESVPGFSNNVAFGNGQDVVNLTSGAQLTQDITITTDNLLGDVLYVSANQIIPASATLTLEAGVVFKMEDNTQVTLNGTLLANGAEGNEVVFTGARDDAIGGDSDGGGGSVGLAGDWRGLTFNTSSTASVLTHVHTAFTGSAGFAAFDINGGDPTLDSCEIRDGSASGVNLNLAAVRPTVTDCVFLRMGEPPIDNSQLESVAGFHGNVASGGVQDVVRVGIGTAITQDITITTDNLIDDVLLLAASQIVLTGTTLTLESGMIVKMPFNGQLTVDGGLVIEGQPGKRVVFTSTADDAQGGDSNGDGALSTPTPGDWRGLLIDAVASGPVSLRYATVEYAGSAGFAGVRNSSLLATMRAVRVDHAAAVGFRLANLMGELLDCVAFDCGSHGFFLESGAFDVRGCDAVGNAGAGFLAAGWNSDVHNSISWDNAGPPFSGIVVSDVFFSNGDASFVGVNENRNINPDFVDQAQGDLRLAVGSGLIDAGAFPVFPSGMDAGGFSRDLDGLLDGVRRVDIGAHEFSNIELSVLGAPAAGDVVTVEVAGTPGLVNTNLIVGLGEIEASFKRFGNLFVDIGGVHVILPWLSAPSAVPLGLPIELPVGLEIQLQAITFTGPVPSMAAGNLSNLVTLTVE